MTKIKNCVWLIVLSLFFVQCEKEYYSSPLQGIRLGGYECMPLTVSAYIGDNKIASTITDSLGLFLFEDLRQGRYTLRFTKENFSEYRVFNVRHLGFDTTKVSNINYSYISKIIDDNVNIESIERIMDYGLEIAYSVDSVNEPNYIWSNRYLLTCFFSRNPKVSKDIYDFYSPQDQSIYLKDMVDFNKSDTTDIYFRVYVNNVNKPIYNNPYTGKDVFSNIKGKGSDVYQIKLGKNGIKSIEKY